MSKEASERRRRTDAQDRERRIQDYAQHLISQLRGSQVHSHFGGGNEDWLFQHSLRTAEEVVTAFDSECRRREAAIELTFGGQPATGSEPPVVTAAAATS